MEIAVYSTGVFNILIDCRAQLCFQEYILESTSPDSGTKNSFNRSRAANLIFTDKSTNTNPLGWWVVSCRACRLILIDLLESEHNLPSVSERNLYSIHFSATDFTVCYSVVLAGVWLILSLAFLSVFNKPLLGHTSCSWGVIHGPAATQS